MRKIDKLLNCVYQAKTRVSYLLCLAAPRPWGVAKGVIKATQYLGIYVTQGVILDKSQDICNTLNLK